jgi:hypothetical protein
MTLLLEFDEDEVAYLLSKKPDSATVKRTLDEAAALKNMEYVAQEKTKKQRVLLDEYHRDSKKTRI